MKYNLDLIRNYTADEPAPKIDVQLLAGKLQAIRELNSMEAAEVAIEQPRWIELLLWLQYKSMQPGGLIECIRQMLIEFPEWIGTPTSRRLGKCDAYRIDECAAIWQEVYREDFGLSDAEIELLLAIQDGPRKASSGPVTDAELDSILGDDKLATIHPDESSLTAFAEGIIKKITPETVWAACARLSFHTLAEFFVGLCVYDDQESACRRRCYHFTSRAGTDMKPVLEEIRAAFESAGAKKLFTRTLTGWLKDRGHELDDRQLAAHLRPLGVTPVTMRVKNVLAKGYCLDDFKGAFARFGVGGGKAQNVWPFKEVWCFQDAVTAAVTLMDRDAQSCDRNVTSQQVSRELDFVGSERVPRCFVAPAMLDAFAAKVNCQPGRWRVVVVPSEPSERDFWAAHADAFGIAYDADTSCGKLKQAVEYVMSQAQLGLAYQRAHLLIPRQAKGSSRRLDWIRGLIERGAPCAFVATPPSVDEFMKSGARFLEQWFGMPPALKLGLSKDDLVAITADKFPEIGRTLVEIIVAHARCGEAAAPFTPALQSATTVAQRARFLASEDRQAVTEAHVEQAARDMIGGTAVPVDFKARRGTRVSEPLHEDLTTTEKVVPETGLGARPNPMDTISH